MNACPAALDEFMLMLTVVVDNEIDNLSRIDGLPLLP